MQKSVASDADDCYDNRDDADGAVDQVAEYAAVAVAADEGAVVPAEGAAAAVADGADELERAVGNHAGAEGPADYAELAQEQERRRSYSASSDLGGFVLKPVLVRRKLEVVVGLALSQLRTQQQTEKQDQTGQSGMMSHWLNKTRSHSNRELVRTDAVVGCCCNQSSSWGVA